MRDYFACYEDGRQVAVADMPTSDIVEHLQDGVKPLGDATVQAIRERLLLELFIREKGLRNE